MHTMPLEHTPINSFWDCELPVRQGTESERWSVELKKIRMNKGMSNKKK